MKKHITLILILMAMCVAGIIGLQLFWNYQNYKSTVKTFDHDINEALNKAVDREMDQRQHQIVKVFKSWMADTSFITITCNYNNPTKSTVFTIRDTHRTYSNNHTISFGLTYFKERINHITPFAKSLVINHFGDRTALGDLKKGTVYFYTQRLGDSLGKVFDASNANLQAVGTLFKEELSARDIHSFFIINPAKNSGLYLTKSVNTNFKRPYHQNMIRAGFESPDTYFLKEMKWIIISTLLLISITLCCFAYTANTLLSQHKLALLKDDFINNMTHELNTPLSSIKITAEALKSFNHQPETQREYLDIISYQAEKLTGLTAQILNTSQLIYADKTTWTSINPNDLIQKAIDDLRPQFNRQRALLNYSPSKSMLYIKGDAGSLLNAFINVIDNALKYTTGNAILNITIAAKNDCVQITFADNGIGIPAEYHDKVFERFFRVPQGNLHNVKGYGLGLSYVSKVIEQHNGSVSVSANEPAGTIITIKIPLS